MTVLDEAVDEGDDAGGAWEDGVPLLEYEVGGDDGSALLVAATDDVVEQVGGARVAGQISQRPLKSSENPNNWLPIRLRRGGSLWKLAAQ